mmetsp:Transcript_8873/g.20534  ORF Transcript_8873/g.20534 Transcript_8873/m.20534 type:complete len:83 (+) Transcript_8873:760-1008(+)
MEFEMALHISRERELTGGRFSDIVATPVSSLRLVVTNSLVEWCRQRRQPPPATPSFPSKEDRDQSNCLGIRRFLIIFRSDLL